MAHHHRYGGVVQQVRLVEPNSTPVTRFAASTADDHKLRIRHVADESLAGALGLDRSSVTATFG